MEGSFFDALGSVERFAIFLHNRRGIGKSLATHDKYTVSYSTIKESQPPSVFLSSQLPALVQ